MRTVEDRLASLERSNRRLRFSLVAVVALLSVGLLAGAAMMPAVQAVVRTRKLELVDNQGRTRAVLGMAAGQPTFSLADAQARPRVALTTGSVTGLQVFNISGDTLSMIGTVQNAPFVALQHPTSQGAVYIGLDGPFGFVEIVDPDGFLEFTAP